MDHLRQAAVRSSRSARLRLGASSARSTIWLHRLSVARWNEMRSARQAAGGGQREPESDGALLVPAVINRRGSENERLGLPPVTCFALSWPQRRPLRIRIPHFASDANWVYSPHRTPLNPKSHPTLGEPTSDDRDWLGNHWSSLRARLASRSAYSASAACAS